MRVRLGFIGILVMLCLGVMFTNAGDQPNQKILLQFESSLNNSDQQLSLISEQLLSLGATNIEVTSSVHGIYIITYTSDHSLQDVQSFLEEYKENLLPLETTDDGLITIKVEDLQAPSGDWNINDVPMVEVRREYLRAQFQPVLTATTPSETDLFFKGQTIVVLSNQQSQKFSTIFTAGWPETRAGPDCCIV